MRIVTIGRGAGLTAIASVSAVFTSANIKQVITARARSAAASAGRDSFLIALRLFSRFP
jgi:hypothetical protein